MVAVLVISVALCIEGGASVWRGGVSGVYAQNAPTSIQIAGPAPSGVTNAGGAIIGFSGQGTPLYYWVIARYPAGSTQPVGPVVVPGTPGAANLSATQYVSLSWGSVTGATGYDVLRNITPDNPLGPTCAACAVVLGTTATSVNDTGAALSAYPPAGTREAGGATVTLTLDATNYSSPVMRAYAQMSGASGSGIVPLAPGVPTSGYCAQWGANGVLSDAGGPCMSSGSLALYQLLTGKNAASGYAGLTAGTKLNAAQGQEVWALADLSDVTGKVGNATTVQMAGAGAPALDDCAKFDANGNVITAGGPCASGGAPSLSGTLAARPAAAAGNTGQLYFANDSSLFFRSTGAAWQSFFGPVWHLTTPALGDYTWVNQGTSSVSDSQGYPIMTVTAQSYPNLRMLVRSLPAASGYTITTAIWSPVVRDYASTFYGVCLYDSAGGKLVTLRVMPGDNRIAMTRWNSVSSLDGDYTILVENTTLQTTPVVLWVKIQDNTTDRIVSVSRDGFNWSVFYSVGRTNFVTPDRFGFFVNHNGDAARSPSTAGLLSYVGTVP